MNRSLETLHTSAATPGTGTSLHEIRQRLDRTPARRRLDFGAAQLLWPPMRQDLIAVERLAHACREKGWV